MSESLYGRKYRVLVSNSNGVALDVSQLRVTFKIIKTVMMQPNMSEIVIYNLSPETENTIIKEGNRVIIEAGYEGEQYGKIFDGNVIQPIRDKEDGTTYKLTLSALDGDRFFNYGLYTGSFTRGLTTRQQVSELSSKAKIPSELGDISSGLSSAKLTRGKVVFGLARDYLRQLAKTENATFYLDDGKVNIIKASDLPTGKQFDLSPASGLIGVPAQAEYGVTAKMLLNPRVGLNKYIHIDNSLVRAKQVELGTIQRSLDRDGLYRVIKITHTGDTRGTEWYTEVETITQAGMIPGMISTGGQSVW